MERRESDSNVTFQRKASMPLPSAISIKYQNSYSQKEELREKWNSRARQRVSFSRSQNNNNAQNQMLNLPFASAKRQSLTASRSGLAIDFSVTVSRSRTYSTMSARIADDCFAHDIDDVDDFPDEVQWDLEESVESLAECYVTDAEDTE